LLHILRPKKTALVIHRLVTMSEETTIVVDDVSTWMSTPVNVTLTAMTLRSVTFTAMTSVLPVVNRSHVWTADVIQRVATLVPLMVATLLGNAVTMVVLSCSRYRSVNSRINIFIINLAAGDLAVCCFTMTTEVAFIYLKYCYLFLSIETICINALLGVADTSQPAIQDFTMTATTRRLQ